MRRELCPLSSEDEDWILPVGSMYAIGRSNFGTDYCYGVCEWANGAKGAIVDLYEVNDEVDSEGKSIFGGTIGHRDCLYFVESEINLESVVKDPIRHSDLWIKCPLIAEGIIARFAKTTPTDRNYTELYEKYYEMEKCFYAIDRKRLDPFAFSANLDDEFANGVHLRQEKRKIEFSLQCLLPFLREEYHDSVKRVAEAYIAFVKSKATKQPDEKTNDGRKELKLRANKKTKKEEKDYSRCSFLLNVDSRKLERLYVLLSKENDKGKKFIDGDLMKNNKVDEEILSNVKVIKDESIRNTAINKYLFNQVFSGQETDVRIVWTSHTNQLWYLINALYNYNIEVKRGEKIDIVRLLEKSEAGQGIWQIVCSRFLNGKKHKVLDERTDKVVEKAEPIEFKETDFHKYSEKNSPRDTSDLDAIIKKIAPTRVTTDIETIEEDTKLSRYGIKDPESAEQLGDGFHDTSHKAKFE